MDPVRAVYDAAADTYASWAGTEIGPRTEMPFDLAVLNTFAAGVTAHPARLVVDVGCGPGRVASFLAARRVEVVGLDVSVAMVRHGHLAHPELPFAVGAIESMPVREGCLAGVVSWYSIIHTPPGSLPGVVAELSRVLAPGGHLLVAFQAGAGEAVSRPEAFGTAHTLTNHRHSAEVLADLLEEAGFHAVESLVRGPMLGHETTPQAFVRAKADDPTRRARSGGPARAAGRGASGLRPD